MTAPTEAEIRDLLTTVTRHGPDTLDFTFPIVDSLSDKFSEVAGRLDHLYDIEDFRKAELERLDDLIRHAIDPIRERVATEIEAALLRAAMTFAAEYPNAPRAKATVAA